MVFSVVLIFTVRIAPSGWFGQDSRIATTGSGLAAMRATGLSICFVTTFTDFLGGGSSGSGEK